MIRFDDEYTDRLIIKAILKERDNIFLALSTIQNVSFFCGKTDVFLHTTCFQHTTYRKEQLFINFTI